MSRLRRFLDRMYDEGRDDGKQGRLRNPGRTEYQPTRGQWAYEAGYQRGRRDLDELRQAIHSDTN